MSKRIAEVQLSPFSLGQMLWGVENQMLMLLSGKLNYFSYPARIIQSNPV